MLSVGSDKITDSNGGATIAIASTAVVYTKAMRVDGADSMSIKLKAATPSGTIDLKVEAEFSDVLPTTEGSADTTNYSEPSGYSDIVNITDTTLFIKEVVMVPAKYMRLKITGQGSNAAGVTLTGQLMKKEWFD